MRDYYKYFFYAGIVIILLISFLAHSPVFSPFYNADDAVVALMIKYFKLPQDLYYWEANRWGSLIPLIGQFFYKALHFSPIEAQAVTHYLILLLGYMGFASLFESKTAKFIFAVVWFLPPARMIDVLKVSQGEQYAIIGMAVFFLNKLYIQKAYSTSIKRNIALVLCSLTCILAVWVSDLAIITICITLFIFTLQFLRNNKSIDYNKIIRRPELYYLIVAFIVGALFIYYAKQIAAKQENFYSFFDPKLVIESIKIFLVSIKDIFLFKAREPFTSLYSYLLLIALILISLNYRTIDFSKKNSIWIAVFSIDLVIVFAVIITSVWSYLNGVPRRYFVCNYISFWIVFLIIIDNLKDFRYKKALYIFLLVTVLMGGIGTMYNYKYVFPKTLRPTRETASEFKLYGKIGIIASYWNSYINSAVDPDNIVATPNDKSVIRKQSFVDSVFKQPKIFIIRDSWMETFPDTLEQFGYTLKRIGKEFKIANSYVCYYKKIRTQKVITFDKMKSADCSIPFDRILQRKTLKAEYSNNICKEKYIAFGPYIPLGIGMYSVKFYLKVDSFQTDKAIALLDVAVDGQTVLATREINKNDFETSNFTNIDLNFETRKRAVYTEFRILYHGNANLYFDHIELIEK